MREIFVFFFMFPGGGYKSVFFLQFYVNGKFFKAAVHMKLQDISL